MPSNEAVRLLLLGEEDERVKELYEGIYLVAGDEEEEFQVK